jgi:hypothetical protein
VISKHGRELMDEHKKTADMILDEEWEKEIPANAFYFLGVIAVSFVIVVLLLILVAR